MEKLDYGNWVPQNLMYYFLIASLGSYLLTYITQIPLIDRGLTMVAVFFLGFFLYLAYIGWLLDKDDKTLQKQFWNLVVEKLQWDGNGKALDIGTGSGPVAIILAKKFPECTVKGIDYWGEPWTYSKTVCESNAEIEGVYEQVSFERASAVALPFDDGEYDAVLSNFVFHAIKGHDRLDLIQEAFRVLKKGGAYSFQDLFNDEFYPGDFLEEVKKMGLAEVNFVDSFDSIHVPIVLRTKHMTGGSGVLFGIK